MAKKSGVRVSSVDKGSFLYKEGLRVGDIVKSVNGNSIEDDIDFSYHLATEDIEIELERKGKTLFLYAEREPGEFHGVEFIQRPIRRCGNRCIFCFVDQLPQGLRKGLYIKDEDYRQSFLYGNYVTLTNLSNREIERIISLQMSPLYISVHVTDPHVRTLMIGNKRAGEIMNQLEYLADNGIEFHTQIVVCPGFNDGMVLKKSIFDLFSIKRGLLSIAVVPVGLTKYTKSDLNPISPSDAREICKNIETWSESDTKKNGFRRLFIADEFLVKASFPIPKREYYEDFAQIENGVGLLRTLVDGWNEFRNNCTTPKLSEKLKSSTVCLITSVSASFYLNEIKDDIATMSTEFEVDVIPVENRLFGSSVTVAGLLNASDVMYAVRKLNKKFDTILLPSVMFNFRGYTLDGYSLDRIRKKMDNKNVEIIDSSYELGEYLFNGK